MRSFYVLLDTTQNRVVLVDFDWTGIDGIDVHPSFMNPDLSWPEGASAGQSLYHDQYWSEDVFNEIKFVKIHNIHFYTYFYL